MKNNSFYATLVAGAIGLAIGAVSVQTFHDVLSATVHYAGPSLMHDRPAVRSLNDDGFDNFESKGPRADVTRTTNTIK